MSDLSSVRHKIVKLEIHGNHYFDTETIREHMSVILGHPGARLPARPLPAAMRTGARSGRHQESVSRQWLPRCGGYFASDRRLQRRPGAYRDLCPDHRRPAMVRFQARFRRRFRSVAARVVATAAVPPWDSPVWQISTSPPIGTTCSITISTTAIPPRNSTSPLSPPLKPIKWI